MKKKSIIIFIIAISVLIICVISEGFSYQNTKYIFTTKYYNTPRKAFEKENDSIEIKEDINIYTYDEYNRFYVALTDNNELIICKMFCKNDKFFFTGDYVTYPLNNSDLSLEDTYNSNVIFNKNGTFKKYIYWRLLINEEKIPENESNLIYNFGNNENHYYVYFITK